MIGMRPDKGGVVTRDFVGNKASAGHFISVASSQLPVPSKNS
jgi:hypothetical protein